MSQNFIPLSEMQVRIDVLSERVASLAAKFQTRITSRAFKNASSEDQGKMLVAGGLLTVIAHPLKAMVEVMQALQPPPEGSNLFADIAAEMAEGSLRTTGIKKDALVFSYAECNSRVLPLMEQFAAEIEQRLA